MNTTMTVRQILQSKGHEYWSISPEATVYDALELMADRNVGALLVLEDGKLAGIFSERDYARKVILKGKWSKTTLVGELMTGKPIVIGPDKYIGDCMVLMTNHHIRHVPVMENGVLMGVLSIRDVVDAIIANQEDTIQELEDIITGNDDWARTWVKSH